jgi:chromosome partitioning protein
MGKRIAVSNQKGGVGKTTTAVNLASALTVYNKKVLLADMDAQGNACSGLGLSVSDDQPSMYNVLLMDMPVRETIIETSIKGLDLIPVNGHLSGAPIELAAAEEREFRLYHALEEIKNEYDYIIIDCPPALDLLTLNGLTAADSVLIPIQCEYYALEGMSKLIKTIRLVQESLNPDLSIEGILLTM